MSDELPEGWFWAQIADVTQRVPNTKPEDSPEKEFGYVDISSIDNARFVVTDVKRFKGKDAPSRARRPIQANDIVFSNVRTYLRNVALVAPDCPAELCSTGFTVLRPNAAVEPRYLFRYVLTDEFIDRVTPQQTGTHYPATSDRVVVSERIPFAPLAEQRRIVTKLEALLGTVDACQKRLEKIPSLLKRFRQSVLAAACSGRLSADWREQNPHIESARSSIGCVTKTVREARVRRGVPENVPKSDEVASWELPETWGCFSTAELLRCGALVDVKDGNHGANHPKVSEFSNVGLPFITAAQVNNFRIDYDGAYKLSGRPLERIRVGFAKAGDVIYTHKGSVGRVAVADRDCVLTPQTTYYRTSAKVYSNEFLMYYLASQAFSEQVDVIKEQTTRDFVPISEQYRLFHRVPPLAEQREIVRQLNALFALSYQIEARYTKAKMQADKLSPALLAKAFRGELVPTEAKLASQEGRDYEPAEVLLERVRGQVGSTRAAPKASRPHAGRRLRRVRTRQRPA